jgi:hypothetical protein
MSRKPPDSRQNRYEFSRRPGDRAVAHRHADGEANKADRQSSKGQYRSALTDAVGTAVGGDQQNGAGERERYPDHAGNDDAADHQTAAASGLDGQLERWFASHPGTLDTGLRVHRNSDSWSGVHREYGGSDQGEHW